jgi:hypothetical protein
VFPSFVFPVKGRDPFPALGTFFASVTEFFSGSIGLPSTNESYEWVCTLVAVAEEAAGDRTDDPERLATGGSRRRPVHLLGPGALDDDRHRLQPDPSRSGEPIEREVQAAEQHVGNALHALPRKSDLPVAARNWCSRTSSSPPAPNAWGRPDRRRDAKTRLSGRHGTTDSGGGLGRANISPI